MEVETLREKLKSLEQQRSKFTDDIKTLDVQRSRILDGVRQIDGAIGFCKGLIEESEKTAPPKTGE